MLRDLKEVEAFIVDALNNDKQIQLKYEKNNGVLKILEIKGHKIKVVSVK